MKRQQWDQLVSAALARSRVRAAPSRSHLGERILAGAQVEPKLLRSLELGHSESFSHRLTKRIHGLRSPIGAHTWAAAPVVYSPLASRNWQSPGGCARKDEKKPRDAHVCSRAIPWGL